MSSLNKAMLIGNLGQDPEVRYTQSNTAVATMSIATNERFKNSNGEWQERTEWHRVVAWGRLAEIVQQYVKKGSQVYVEGPIQTRQWEDQQGQKRYTTEIKALTLKMLDSRNENNMTVDRSNSQETSAPQSQPVDLNDGSLDDLDDDLPF